MNQSLSQLIAKPEIFHAVWSEVRVELPTVPVVRQAVSNYEHRLSQHFQELADDIMVGRHRVVTLHDTVTPSHLLAYLDDAVIQRAVCYVLSRALANKPSREVSDVATALQQWQHYQARGYQYVLFSQLAGYPHQPDVELLLQHLNAQLADQPLSKLFEQWRRVGLLFDDPPLLQVENPTSSSNFKTWLTQCWQSVRWPWSQAEPISDQAFAEQVWEMVVQKESDDDAHRQVRRAALRRLLSVAALAATAVVLVYVSARFRRFSWPKTLLALGGTASALSAWVMRSQGVGATTQIALAPQTQAQLEVLLTEISLRDFDATLSRDRHPLIRMNGQLAFPVSDEAQAEHTYALIEQLARQRGWQLEEEQSYVVSAENVEAFIREEW